MELRHLRYFVALAECLSFTRAAERVHVTQSTLSHQIRQLEDELGHPLFERMGKRVVLTEAGETFVAYASRALLEVDHGLAHLKRAGDELTGEVRIGATGSFNVGFVPECLAIFLKRNPTVKVSVEELSADTIGQRLIDETLEVGVAYEPPDPTHLWFEPLYTEEMVLVVGPRHPLAQRKRVRMVELHRQNLVLLPHSFATRTLAGRVLPRLRRRTGGDGGDEHHRADDRAGGAHAAGDHRLEPGGHRRRRREADRAGKPDADAHARHPLEARCETDARRALVRCRDAQGGTGTQPAAERVRARTLSLREVSIPA